MDQTVAPPFSVTDRAARRIARIVAQEAKSGGPADQAMRVAVLAGGCSGFQYQFGLDAHPAADDLVIDNGTARVVIDPVSLDLLAGSELDFDDTSLMGAYFTVRNPQASSACGCGTSFSVA